MTERIDLSKYLREKYGIDDSNFAIPFKPADVIIDKMEEGGPLVAVTYCQDPEAGERCERNLLDIARRSLLGTDFWKGKGG